ncbi:MAG: hypothetical protein ACJ768_16670 [Gaiellaceae bacterium]
MNQHMLRLGRLVGLSVALAMVLAASTVAPARAAADPRFAPCVLPGGLDPFVPGGTVVQQFFGVSTSIVASFCPVIKAGARWTVIAAAFSAKTYEAFPAGYEPGSARPLDDFRARFVGVKIYVDEGTPQAFTVEWANSPKLWAGDWGPYDLASPITLGTVRPLSVGAHSERVAYVMSEMACDGTSAETDLSCIPAGETSFPTVHFTVVP